MKKIALMLALGFCMHGFAQNTLHNNGTELAIATGCIIQVNGDAQFATGSTLTNNGSIFITGNITNNQTMSAANTGSLELRGNALQLLNGSSMFVAKNLTINNAAGITVNAPLKIDGVLTFTNGIVGVADMANAVVLTNNATVTGMADASHINGYVVKEGIGNFTYPTGDGTKYQPITTNLSTNAIGMRVKYNASNAGAASFSSAGTENTPLVSYNTNEYWEVLPLSNATGTVTVFWDGYKDAFANPLSQRKVARNVGLFRYNEGNVATGTITNGSVTSNNISSWGAFTLGSIGSVLPISWLQVNGTINNQQKATLNWKVQEANVNSYVLEKSTDGRLFVTIGNVNSLGNGVNSYQFTDAQTLAVVNYYRIKQIDNDGKYSYSSIIKLASTNKDAISVYPNPAKDFVMIQVSNQLLQTNAQLIDISGKVLQVIKIAHNNFSVAMSQYPKGTYLLRFDNGRLEKIVKE